MTLEIIKQNCDMVISLDVTRIITSSYIGSRCWRPYVIRRQVVDIWIPTSRLHRSPWYRAIPQLHFRQTKEPISGRCCRVIPQSYFSSGSLLRIHVPVHRARTRRLRRRAARSRGPRGHATRYSYRRREESGFVISARRIECRCPACSLAYLSRSEICEPQRRRLFLPKANLKILVPIRSSQRIP